MLLLSVGFLSVMLSLDGGCEFDDRRAASLSPGQVFGFCSMMSLVLVFLFYYVCVRCDVSHD